MQIFVLSHGKIFHTIPCPHPWRKLPRAPSPRREDFSQKVLFRISKNSARGNWNPGPLNLPVIGKRFPPSSWWENRTESWASEGMSRGFDPHLEGSCVDNPSLNGGAFQISITFVDGVGGSNRVHKTFAPQPVSGDYPFPENVEKPNRHP
jgi:hypothetical protein